MQRLELNARFKDSAIRAKIGYFSNKDSVISNQKLALE